MSRSVSWVELFSGSRRNRDVFALEPLVQSDQHLGEYLSPIAGRECGHAVAVGHGKPDHEAAPQCEGLRGGLWFRHGICSGIVGSTVVYRGESDGSSTVTGIPPDAETCRGGRKRYAWAQLEAN